MTIKKFGVQDQFEIWLDYYYITYKDDPAFIENPHKYEMGGDVYFWVNGKNLFAFKYCEPNATYSFDLNILIKFFCDNLIYHIMDDPFPVKTIANNAIDMMEETKLVQGDDSEDLSKWAEVDWDNVDMSIRNNITSWNCHHGFLMNSGGSFLPHVYIRRVDNQIEVSWYNKYPRNGNRGKVYLMYKKGVEYVDLKLYRDTVAAFCLDFITIFKDKPWVSEYKANLQKALDVSLG